MRATNWRATGEKKANLGKKWEGHKIGKVASKYKWPRATSAFGGPHTHPRGPEKAKRPKKRTVYTNPLFLDRT